MKESGVKRDRRTVDPCPGDKGYKVPLVDQCFAPWRFNGGEFSEDFQDSVQNQGETIAETAGSLFSGAAAPIGDAIEEHFLVIALIGVTGYWLNSRYQVI